VKQCNFFVTSFFASGTACREVVTLFARFGVIVGSIVTPECVCVWMREAEDGEARGEGGGG
jgi:hypothetical protein